LRTSGRNFISPPAEAVGDRPPGGPEGRHEAGEEADDEGGAERNAEEEAVRNAPIPAAKPPIGEYWMAFLKPG